MKRGWRSKKAGAYAAPVPKRARPQDELSQFNIRMPKALIEALDAQVEEHRNLHPGRMFTRSDLIRDVLYEYVRRHEAKKKGG